jgi:hypothetical protein
LTLLPRLSFLAGRDGAAENLPERVVYGPNALACLPGDFERATRDGDFEMGMEDEPNGEAPGAFAVTNGDAEAYESNPEDPNLTDDAGVWLLNGIWLMNAVADVKGEDVGGFGMLILPNVGVDVLDPKMLGAFLEVLNGDADEA